MRVDAEVKAGLLDLVAHATSAGWSARAACQLLGLDDLRLARWVQRAAQDRLVDAVPGGAPLHGLLDWERAAIDSSHLRAFGGATRPAPAR